uniref:Uncharacterized protein n=1 Tax=Guillardia theta TaxID=55529 RepID=A0A6U6CGC1_GUITH
MCDSFFLTAVGSVDNREYKGREGTRRLEERIEKVQLRYEEAKYTQARCPTCVEACSGKRYSEWLTSDIPAVLSPCSFAIFDPAEPPPVYIDESDGSGKPRWTLLQGVGPKTLELDSSRSNRIYKPTLREAMSQVREGDKKAWEPFRPQQSTDEHRNMVDYINTVVFESNERKALYACLFRHVPLFSCADPTALEQEIETLRMEASMMQIEEMNLSSQELKSQVQGNLSEEFAAFT